MRIKAVLFDLDGTLLPMNIDDFTKSYFGRLSGKLAHQGYEPKALIGTILQGTKAMIKNDGSKTNEEVFWDSFTSVYGKRALDDIPYFDEFYKTDFDLVKESVTCNPFVKKTVDFIKNLGLRMIVATNPLFPEIAQRKRIKWAGLNINDFEYVTSYENSHYCKPNPMYFKEILEKTNLKAEECIMVGNHTKEDTCGEIIGIKTFLVTDCLINDDQVDINKNPNGTWEDLKEFIKTHI